LWNDPELLKLFLAHTPLIDVRSPIEFAKGSLPNSVNLPLMSDEERHLIGIEYKERGQEAAIKLGHQFVSGEVKSARVKSWVDYISAHPEAQVLCFRGGLRSQISCQWITEAGIPRKAIPGGYKRLRQFFISYLDSAPLPKLTRLAGLTGSGKTTVLQKLKHHVDLEELAHHRGSSFGSLGKQPGQISFENNLALKLMENPQEVICEDESVMLGQIRLPKRFFEHLRASPMVLLRTSQDERIRNIFQDYVLQQDLEFFKRGTEKISRRLGGLLYKTILESLERAFAQGKDLQHHQEWIALLLEHYYDPIYGRDLERQKDLIRFSGTAPEILEQLLKGE
jgi:tRNA 2-selenouridine synthase